VNPVNVVREVLWGHQVPQDLRVKEEKLDEQEPQEKEGR